MAQNNNADLMAIFYEDSTDALNEWERICLELKPSSSASSWEGILRCAHNIKGGAGLIGLQNLYKSVHKFEDFLVQLRDRTPSASPELIAALLSLEKFIRSWIEIVRTDAQAVLDSTEIERTFEKLLANPIQSPSAEPPTPLPQPPAGEKIAPPVIEMPSQKGDETLRVSSAKLDKLIQLVGEVALHQAMIDRASRDGTLPSVAIRDIIEIKSKLTQDLQDVAMGLRLIPVEGIFQRVERVARETAAQVRKLVTVIRRGDQVTIDKVVVDRIMDPLIHLTRNAIDHGIESLDERIAAGKRPQGFIRVSAENTAAGVTITFEDDGRGIDPEKIYKKALEKRLISPNQELSTKAKMNLIFLPGFSTVEKVTDLSGRGVGMNIVSEAVAKMGGRIDVDSAVSEGTRFIITLPSNLSILDALIVEVGGYQYAIPNQDLSEVVNLNDLPIQSVSAGKGRVINFRGKIVPIEDMARLLRHNGNHIMKGKQKSAAPSTRTGLIVQFRDEVMAFRVDDVLGQQQVFVRPVIQQLMPVDFFGGSTILNDGEPSVILNLNEMARHYFESQAAGL